MDKTYTCIMSELVDTICQPFVSKNQQYIYWIFDEQSCDSHQHGWEETEKEKTDKHTRFTKDEMTCHWNIKRGCCGKIGCKPLNDKRIRITRFHPSYQWANGNEMNELEKVWEYFTLLYWCACFS